MSIARAKAPPSNRPCPCGLDATYAACCGRFHAGLRRLSEATANTPEAPEAPDAPDPAAPLHAPTPEALMRSRYSAYLQGDIAYLLATWHGSTAPGELDLQPLKWLGLEVRHALQEGDAGVVEFVARYRDLSQGGKAGRLHELSRFVREGGRWLYVDGQQQDDPQADDAAVK